MNHRPNRMARGATLLGGYLFAWSLSAAPMSEYGVTEPGAPVRPAARPGSGNIKLEDAARGLPRAEPKKRTLRCWQYGQLIVERRVDRVTDSAPRIVDIGKKDERQVQLYDFRSSTCLLE